MPTDVTTLSGLQIAAAIEQRTLSCEAFAHAYLERIASREPVVHAWTVVDSKRTLDYARELDRGPRRGLLQGMPVAVKDIIDTADLPTEYGSPIYKNHQPVADAACVAILRAAGGCIPGKAVTTEFAYYFPGPTTNPANPAHTPGGSSSGSAAAVADGMVPFGVGTQTAGSVIRPAAFCGIVGYKPTFNRLSLTGVKTLSASLDTLGCMARSVDDIELLRATLTGEAYRPLERPSRCRIGVYRGVEWNSGEPYAQQAVLDVAETFQAFAEVDDIEPANDAASDAHQTIMAFEMAQSLTPMHKRHRDSLSEPLCALIDRGSKITFDAYVDAQNRASALRLAMDALFEARDVLLTPSAPGEAPEGLEGTGDPVFNRRWTLAGLPAATIPTHRGPRGLPVGVQLIGRRDGDRDLLAIAREIDARMR
jgi:Asp-tRNA(Asn)/Glu-tRNA(Gln) amidotransferase A subunit family amidase